MKRTLRLLGAVLLVNGVLLSAEWFFSTGEPIRWLALEAAFLAGAFLILPRRAWTLPLVVGGSALVVLLGVLAFSDAATRLILARPLNLYLDLRLARSVYDLLAGTLGPTLAVVSVTLAGSALVGVTALLAHLLWTGAAGGGGSEARRVPGSGERLWIEKLAGGVLVAPLAGWLVVAYLPGVPLLSLPPGVGTPGVDLIRIQAGRVSVTLEEEERFAAELAASPAAYAQMEGLLGRLAGRDVILAFVESYGVSTIDDPRYSSVILPRLEEFGRQMEAAGISLASGTLVAPTQGGQSWFSHGSLLSGLWIDNQLRYDLMLRSDRETLIDDFRRAGYRTVALMPAITFAWPEGEQLGYDQVFARRDISYAGPPLNWVTMPDQFSWSFLERSIRGRGDASGGVLGAPVFIEVGLISSHAPWTPILPVLDDWDQIEDGSVFSSWADAGERPEELWLDTERVREHFALSVDYALHTMASYAERYVDEDVLVIVLGDHQPAPLVTGEGVSWEVPVHVISGDPALVDSFEEWGFDPGPLPNRDHAERGMDQFREWFVHTFSSVPAAVAEAETR